MTEAAGPDSMVSTGRFFISLISITPPSPRMIISGTVTPAVRVRRVRPYSLVMSEAMVVGRFFSVQTS